MVEGEQKKRDVLPWWRENKKSDIVVVVVVVVVVVLLLLVVAGTRYRCALEMDELKAKGMK